MERFLLVSSAIHLSAWLLLMPLPLKESVSESVSTSNKLLVKIKSSQEILKDRGSSFERLERIDLEDVPDIVIPDLNTAFTQSGISAKTKVPRRITAPVEERIGLQSAYNANLNETKIHDSLGELDPLAGLEPENQSAQENKSSMTLTSKRNIWSLSWLNGENRKIVFSPKIDVNGFPLHSDKLIDVIMEIQVSPEGNIIHARLLPPGSGDTRLDSYIYSLALQVILEPLPDSRNIQNGEIRLLFQRTGA